MQNWAVYHLSDEFFVESSFEFFVYLSSFFKVFSSNSISGSFHFLDFSDWNKWNRKLLKKSVLETETKWNRTQSIKVTNFGCNGHIQFYFIFAWSASFKENLAIFWKLSAITTKAESSKQLCKPIRVNKKVWQLFVMIFNFEKLETLQLFFFG